MTDHTLPRWKKTLFAIVLLALLLVVVELTAWVAGTIVYGERFSRGRLQAMRKGLVESRGRVAGRPRWIEDEVLHPYVGFVPAERVLRGRGGVARMITTWGAPTWPPIPPNPRRAPGNPGHSSTPAQTANQVVVAVVGGSFAFQFAEEGLPHLIARLRELPAFRGKTFVGLNAAVGGHKQPQQLMTVAYLLALGERIDILINLDGFNEIALHPTENAPARVFPAYPRRWHQRVEGVLSRDALRAMLERAGLEDRRTSLARSFSRAPWRSLNTSSLVYLALDARVEAQLADADRKLLAVEQQAAGPAVATGPAFEFKSEREMLGYLVDLWRRSSREIHDLAAGAGVRYYHFLQPNQYVPASKPMGADETRDAVRATSPYRSVVAAAYPLLRESGQALAAAGVRFHDLTTIYAPHPEPIYVDNCCHVNTRGSVLVADRVFEAISR